MKHVCTKLIQKIGGGGHDDDDDDDDDGKYLKKKGLFLKMLH
jgi:hypothetical protein